MVDIKKIETKRAEYHYSQRQMAKLMGYETHATYQRKIKGERQFTVEDIVKLCEIFQLELNDLIILNK